MKKQSKAIASSCDDAFVITGSAEVFAKKLASSLHLPLVLADVAHFPDGETRVFVKDPLLRKKAIVVQSLARKPNDYLIEAFLLIDALLRRGVRSITVVCPYLAYARQSIGEIEGGSIGSRLLARFLKEAGIERLVVMDLHAEHIPAFYDFPVEHITARQLLIKEIKKRRLNSPSLVAVGPDLGASKPVALYAEELGVDFALISKKRLDAKHVHSLSFVGEVKGKDVLLADDMCSTAGTLVSAAKACREKGAKKIFACVTHGLFSEDAIARIEESPIELLLVSDTITPTEEMQRSKKICVVSVVPAFSAILTQKVL